MMGLNVVLNKNESNNWPNLWLISFYTIVVVHSDRSMTHNIVDRLHEYHAGLYPPWYWLVLYQQPASSIDPHRWTALQSDHVTRDQWRPTILTMHFIQTVLLTDCSALHLDYTFTVLRLLSADWEQVFRFGYMQELSTSNKGQRTK